MFNRSITRMYHTAMRIKQQHGLTSLVKASLSEFAPFIARYFVDKPDIDMVTTYDSLKFVEYAKPSVSIIIPAFNNIYYTYNCLRSILLCKTEVRYEVIVVDDYSSDATQAVISACEGIKYVRNVANLGYLRSCNKAAEIAAGDYLVMLNNDILVTRNWLDELYQVITASEDYGLVGSKLIYPDGTLQEAGGLIWSDGSGCNFGRGSNPKHPDYSFLRETDYCSAASLIIRKKNFMDLGGYSEEFLPAYYEDTDLAFQLKAKGLSVLFNPLSVVIHFEGKSHGNDLESGLKKHQVINKKLFAEKWQEQLLHHPDPIPLPKLKNIRRNDKHLLIIDSRMITPNEDSGSYRMFHMIKLLVANGYEVTFVPGDLTANCSNSRNLQRLGVKVIYAPFYSVTSYVKKHAADYEIVIISRLSNVKRYFDLVRCHAPKAQIIYDTVDLHHLRKQREIEHNNKLLIRFQYKSDLKSELKFINKSDKTIVVSNFEKDYLTNLGISEKKIKLCSNIHTIKSPQNSFADRKDILFVGGFEHPPNVDAVNYFIKEILPMINNRNIKLLVAGSKPPKEILSLQSSRVEVLGFVEDLDSLLEKVKFTVAPLRYGAGVKGKVNYSMSRGVPVVLTTVAAEGMHLRNEVDAAIADTPKAFANYIERLNTDPLLWETISNNAIKNVEQYFSVDTAKKNLADVLEMKTDATTIRK